MINWTQCTREDIDTIGRITDRVWNHHRTLILLNRMTLFMDIQAAHCNGNPLRLQDLLNAPDEDFAHDITGIQRHIDRTTGQLTDFFVPRYSVIEQKE